MTQWTVDLVAEDIRSFPIDAYRACFVSAGATEWYDLGADIAPLTARVTLLWQSNDAALYECFSHADDDLTALLGWDSARGVFWFCGWVKDYHDVNDLEWCAAVARSERNVYELLQPTWWAALAAGWLYRTKLSAPPKDLLSALDRILQS